MTDERIQALNNVASTYVSQIGAGGTGKDENDVSIFNHNDGMTVTTNKVSNPEKTIDAIKKEIQSGNAEYVGRFKAAFMQFDRHRVLSGALIMLGDIPEGCKTLGDIKRYYNLPDGCLRNNIVKGMGGGEYDRFTAYPPISIHVETLAEGLGITVDDIRAWFNEK